MGGIIPAFAATGNTIYGTLMSASDAKMANGVSLEAYVQANWGQYVIAMPEQAGSGRYILTVPAIPAGRYYFAPYIQDGGSPAVGVDTPLDIITFEWDGANIVGISSGIDIGSINGSVPAAVALKKAALNYVTGAAVAGTLTTSQMTTDLACAVANQYAGRVLYFTSGANQGRAALITAYTVAGGKLAFVGYNNQAISSAPSVADTFIIV